MKKIIIPILLIWSLFNTNISLAQSVSTTVKLENSSNLIVDKYVARLTLENNTNDEILTKLQTLKLVLDKYYKKPNLKPSIKTQIIYLNKAITKRIETIQYQQTIAKINSNQTTQNNYPVGNNTVVEQKKEETKTQIQNTEFKPYWKNNDNLVISWELKNILTNLNLQYYEVDDFYEYNENSTNYKINFKQYYNVTLSELNNKYGNSQFKGKTLLKLPSWKYIIPESTTIEKELSTSELLNLFKYKQNVNEWKYFIEEGKVYFYNYSKYVKYWEQVYRFKSSILNNSINNDKNALLILESWEKIIVDSSLKTYLISESTLSSLNSSQKNVIYWILSEDLMHYNSQNIDYIMSTIVTKTNELTSSTYNNEEKIKKIYDYIISLITYDYNYQTTWKQVHSWIETFKNASWVCEWYAKLMVYMLQIAWITNSDVVTWFVIDSEDFPNIWHAWVKIGDKYYDPTFDDTEKNVWNYQYFWLDKDLMNVNRISYEELDQYKNLSKTQIQDIVDKNYFNIALKYRNLAQKYERLNKYIIKNLLNLSYNEDITVDKIVQKVNVYSLDSYGYYTDNNWNKQKITWTFSYYPLNDNTLEYLILTYWESILNNKIFRFNWNLVVMK